MCLFVLFNTFAKGLMNRKKYSDQIPIKPIYLHHNSSSTKAKAFGIVLKIVTVNQIE